MATMNAHRPTPRWRVRVLTVLAAAATLLGVALLASQGWSRYHLSVLMGTLRRKACESEAERDARHATAQSIAASESLSTLSALISARDLESSTRARLMDGLGERWDDQVADTLLSLAADSSEERALRLNALQRLSERGDLRVAPIIVRIAAFEPEVDEYHALPRALRVLPSSPTAAALTEVLAHDFRGEALGRALLLLEEARLAPHLDRASFAQWLSSDCVYTRERALFLLAKRCDHLLAPLLIAALADADDDIRHMAACVLRDWSGMDHGMDQGRWRQWYDEVSAPTTAERSSQR